MALTHLPDWHAGFADASVLFAPLHTLAAQFSGYTRWPGLDDYQHLLDRWPHPVLTHTGKSLRVVAQDCKPQFFEQHYAPRIYFTGELQTRTENWHDFFQLLTWLMFPNTKALINSLHVPYARARIEQGGDVGRRSPLENMLSLFDEGGAVLVSSDPELLQWVRDFRWKALFWGRRDTLAKHFECITFGHAMYEKALAPYLGMTANGILLPCTESFFSLDWQEKWAWIDQQLVAVLKPGTVMQAPRDLQPFPILGMPGWDVDNAAAAYYDNVSYFRPGRRRQ